MKPRQLSSLEEKKISEKLAYILTDKNFDLLRNASTVSLIAALIPLFAFYNSVEKIWLLSWVGGMTLVHLICIGLVFLYKNSDPESNKDTRWINVARTGVFLSTLMWGTMGMLLVPDTATGQNFILFFLIVISSAVALGTSVDYVSSSIGIINSLIFYIGWQFYEGIVDSSSIHFYAGTILILYLLFLQVVSISSYKLLKKSLILSFRNAALANKLTDANSQLASLNSELEDRVTIRTKELNSALETVTHQATHDLVTSLPNQTWMLHHISDLILRHPHQSFAIICLSINNMENITDRFGYFSNDKIIKEVSERLINTIEKQPQTCIYNVGITKRDVFVIVVKNIEDKEVSELIKPILNAFEEPIQLSNSKNVEYEHLFSSIGYSIYPHDATIADQLLIKADSARFYTKKQYENNFEHRYEPYKKEYTDTVQYKVTLRKNIIKAIDKDEFFLCYQPLVDIKSGLIANTEALLRWCHPETGVPVPPSEIIQVAEDYNLIIPLGEWVLRNACRQNYLWNKLGFKNIVSVNLSAKQFDKGDIIKTVTETLKETRLNPELLDLELTETEAFKENALGITNHLRELGISLSIDDYGKGFSNLSQLKKIYFNKIKIDMEFIQTLPDDLNSQIIVTSSIKMAKALGIKVVAEGVETQEQYEFLEKHGCDLVQGYLLFKPMTADKITELLIKQKQV